MQVLTITYLSYMFISLYMLFFFLLIYFRNKETMFECPQAGRQLTASIVVPCYNEESSIRETVEAILKSDYAGLKKVIVVDDCSTDNSYSIIKEMARKDSRILAVKTPKNMGRAASAKNYGARFADTEIIGFSDADSFPEKDAVRKCMGFFNNAGVGAVTCSVMVKNRSKFIEKLQAMEYATIAWTRKLLGYVDGIWAMPGPLALYRADVFRKISGFDEENLTEDIEITWKIIRHGYKVEMCLPALVYSIAPSKFWYWFKQRIRWDIGGMQCLAKYKGHWASKLGYFIIPFFALSMFLGLIGIAVYSYVGIKGILQKYLFAKYSILTGTHILAAEDFNISPSILNFFGIALFILGFLFVMFALKIMKESNFKGAKNIFNFLFYMLVYLTVYPLILVFAIGKVIKCKIQGKRIGWGTR